LEFATGSDATLSSVLYFTLSFFFASAVSLLFCFFMRIKRQRKEIRSAQVEQQWREFCFQALMVQEPEKLPPMDQRDLYDLVEMWLQTFDRIRGADAAKGLIRLGQWLDFENRLLPWLKSNTIDEKLLAIMALGLLKERRALDVIRERIDDPYPLISLAAMKAFMEIEPEQGLPELLKRIDTPGWPIGRVRQLISAAPRTLQTHYVTLAAETLSEEQLPKLFELIYALAPSEASDAAKLALRRHPDSAPLLLVIIKHTTDPQFLPLVRASCRNSHPPLRHESLTALGRMGDQDDMAQLIQALNCDIWINQQAAANSLMTIVNEASAAQAIMPVLTTESARLHWSELLFQKGWLLPAIESVWVCSETSPRTQVAYHG